MSPKLRANLRPTPCRLVPCREGTKQARAVTLLARPEGATPEELVEACSPWSWETVKSFLYHDINSVKGYGLRSEDDGRRLFLVYPEGVEAPLPHTPLLPVKKASAYYLDLARRIEQSTGKSPAEMRHREVLDVCQRLNLLTEKGLPFNEGTAADFRRRLRAFLESS